MRRTTSTNSPSILNMSLNATTHQPKPLPLPHYLPKPFNANRKRLIAGGVKWRPLASSSSCRWRPVSDNVAHGCPVASLCDFLIKNVKHLRLSKEHSTISKLDIRYALVTYPLPAFSTLTFELLAFTGDWMGLFSINLSRDAHRCSLSWYWVLFCIAYSSLK